MPIVASVFGALTMAWISDVAGSRRMLCAVLLSTALTTPLVALVLIGPLGLSSVQCDAASAPYIFVIVSLCSVVGIFAYLNEGASAIAKFGLVCVAALAIFAGFSWFFPSCLAGPYAIIDPISRHYWFDRVIQEHSIAIYSGSGAIPQITLITIFAIVLGLALPVVIMRTRSGRIQELVLYASALSALLMTFTLIRFLNFADALVPLLLPVAVDRVLYYAGERLQKLPSGLFLALVGPVVISVLFFTTVPRDLRTSDTIDVLDGDGCERADFRQLAELPPGLIIAPAGLSMTIAMHAPPGLSVAGIPFHRASPGLRRTYLAFTSSDSDIRREALAPFDYLAVCEVPVPLDIGQAPLYAALATGSSWPGLSALDAGTKNPLRVFRIEHDQLR